MKDMKDFGGSEPPEKKKSPASRLLLLLLLLIILGGAGFYLYVDMFESPPSAPVTVVKKPIAIPPKPAKTEVALSEPAIPAESAPGQPPAAEGKPVAQKDALVESQPATLIPPPPETSEPLLSLPDKGVQKAPEVAPKTSPRGRTYTVQAGAFLLKSNLSRSQKKIRDLGYEPKVRIKEKVVPVTRLRVGEFSAVEGKAKLAQIVKVAPAAFTVSDGDRVIVYAGSYPDIDRARSISDRLYEKGIQIEEETVELPQPLHILSFGEFPDLKSAREAAARAKKAGIDVFVTKNP